MLEQSQVDRLRSELDRVIGLDENSTDRRPVRLANLSRDESSVVWQIVDIWKASSPYKELIFSPRTTDNRLGPPR